MGYPGIENNRVIFMCERVDTVMIDFVYNKEIGIKSCYYIMLGHEDNTYVLDFSHKGNVGWFQAMYFEQQYIHILVKCFITVSLCYNSSQSNAYCLVWCQYIVLESVLL